MFNHLDYVIANDDNVDDDDDDEYLESLRTE